MRITKYVACIILVLLMLLPISAGCNEKSPIEQATICTEVSSEGEPVTPVTTLSPDAVNIYCSVKLTSPSAESKVRADWYIIQSEDGQYSDYLIATETIDADTPYIVFGFVRSDKLLPRGEYQVKLHFDEKYILSAGFNIQGEAATSKAVISEAVMCTSVSLLDGKPLDTVSVFPNDSSILYCSCKVVDASFSTVIKARWTYLKGELEGMENRLIYTASDRVEGREYVNFSLGRSEGKPFPKGDYAVTLLVEEQEQASIEFVVLDEAEIKGPFISEAITFALTDEEQQKIEATARFASTVKEIGVSARAYNFPPGSELSVKWILARSDDAIYADYLLKEDKTIIEGTAPILAILKRGENDMPKGDYQVVVGLDGKDVITLQFRVQ